MSQQSTKKFGFTLIELLVVISIIALLLGILVPVLGNAQKGAKVMKEGANLRNIHVGLVTYGTGNKNWFPGLTSAGAYQGWGGAGAGAATTFAGKYYAAATNAASATSAIAGVGAATSYAQAALMEDGGSTPAQWYSPGETNMAGGNPAVAIVGMQAATPNTAPTGASIGTTGTTGSISYENNSFASLAYGSSSLKAEWQSNQNSQAAIIATRMMGGAAQATLDAKYNTIWTDSQSGKFRGSIVHGDSSTSQENFGADPSVTFSVLRYGSVTGSVATAATNGILGVFGSAAKGASVAVDATTGDTYGTAAGNFGAGATSSGVFQTAMIGSAND